LQRFAERVTNCWNFRAVVRKSKQKVKDNLVWYLPAGRQGSAPGKQKAMIPAGRQLD